MRAAEQRFAPDKSVTSQFHIADGRACLKDAKDKSDATVSSLDEAIKKASEALSKYGERLYKAAAEAEQAKAGATEGSDSKEESKKDDSKGDQPEEGEVVDEGKDK